MHKPILYLIASPVGNLRDISMRALDILAQTPLLAAEDTRRARQLLAAHGIGGKKVMSLRAHNESRAAQELIRQMQTAKQAAYLSDAGTPGVSDPGAKLVRMARAAQIRISSVPGASALTCLLAAAGTESAVHFFGFPPRAAAARKSFLATIPSFAGAVVLFESPRRIAALVSQLRDILGDNARAVIGREMTKLHEQIEESSLAEMAEKLQTGEIPARGEFAILVESPGRAPLSLAGDLLFETLAAELPPRRAAKIVARFTGDSAASYYRRRLARTPRDDL